MCATAALGDGPTLQRGVDDPRHVVKLPVSRKIRFPPIPKEAGTKLGMPWEQSYGYAQAVRVGDTIWVSGQLSHDNEGNIVGPAPVDAQGRILDHGNMRIQMAQWRGGAARCPGDDVTVPVEEARCC